MVQPYNRGYPPDGSSLGQTKLIIRNNLDGTFDTVAVDHVNNNGQPGGNPAGYHTLIHQVSQTSVSTVAGVNQVFSGVPGTLIVNGVTTPDTPNNGDTQLYNLTGTGILSQLTGSVTGTNPQGISGTDGWAWSGGLLYQWGSRIGSNFSSLLTGSIVFATRFPNGIAFPNNCFNVQCCPLYQASSLPTNAQAINVLVPGGLSSPTPVAKTGFSWATSGDSSSCIGFFWYAIGN